MSWKTLKQTIKQHKKKETQKEISLVQDIDNIDWLESILKRTKSNPIKADDIQTDSQRFKGFLEKFKDNNEFISFLNRIDLSQATKELITFRNEYVSQLKTDMSYYKFLRFNNYTTYDKRVLLMTAFNHFFSDKPKKVNVKRVVKGIMAKAEQTKTSRKKNKGTQKEYMYTTMFKDSIINMWLKVNATMLRQDITPDIDPVYSEDYKVKDGYKEKFVKQFLSTVQKDTMRNVNQYMGYIRTYAYKYMVQRLTAYQMKQTAKNKRETKAKRLEKVKDNNGFDYSLLKEFTTKEFGKTPLNKFDPNTKQFNKAMTILFRIVKLKKYQALTKLIQSSDSIDKLLAKDLANKLLVDFNKKLRTFQSDMS